MFDSREYEYADVKVSILGISLSGLRGVTYKKAWEKEPVYGQGNNPKAIQRGNKKYDGNLMCLKSDFDLLNAAAISAGYDDIVDVPGKDLNITVAYAKDGDPNPKIDALMNLEFTDAEDGMKTGEKFKEVTLPFIFLKLKRA